jgi:hypothetical protein
MKLLNKNVIVYRPVEVEEEVDDPEEEIVPNIAAPQLKLGPDGKFILDDTSLVSLIKICFDLIIYGHFRLLKQPQLVRDGEHCRPASELVSAKGDPTEQLGLTKVCQSDCFKYLELNCKSS